MPTETANLPTVTATYQPHVQDRLNHREQSRRIVERLFAAGRVEDAVAYTEAEIEPINDWLLARGIW